MQWAATQRWAAGLANGSCGLSDGSVVGDWRVPTKDELVALTTGTDPVLSSTLQLFSNVQAYIYWSSSTAGGNYVWYVGMDVGLVGTIHKGNSIYVWPVRGGN